MRCKALAEDVLARGFLKDDVEHMAVCIEARPAEVSAQKYGCTTNPDSTFPVLTQSFTEYNIHKCRADVILSECIKDGAPVVYGSISHSHMALAIRAFKAGAKWGIEPFKTSDSMTFPVCNANGELSLAAVAAHANGSELATVAQMGMEWEVLSWKIDVEEPDAASVISTALNSAQQIAMSQTEVQAIHCLNGLAIAANAANATSVAFETVRENARKHLGHVVDDLEFVDLYSFCNELGMGKHSYVLELLDFMSQWVDSSKRRIKYSAFAEANKLGAEYPWTKVALIKSCYRRKPSGIMCPNPSPFWGQAQSKGVRLQDCEALLRFFHHSLQQCMKDMHPKSRNMMLANVDVAIATTLEAMKDNKDAATTRRALCKAAAAKAFDLLDSKSTNIPEAEGSDWVRSLLLEEHQTNVRARMEQQQNALAHASADRPAASATANAAHPPEQSKTYVRVAEFDERTGVLISKAEGVQSDKPGPSAVAAPQRGKQDKQATPLTPTLHWDAWMRDPDQAQCGPDVNRMHAVATWLQHIHDLQYDEASECSVLQHADKIIVLMYPSGPRVKASRDFDTNELRLWPHCTGFGRLQSSTQNPQAVPISCQRLNDPNKIKKDDAGEAGADEGERKSKRQKKAEKPSGPKTSDGLHGAMQAAVAADSGRQDHAYAPKHTIYILPDLKMPTVNIKEPSTPFTFAGDEKMHPFWMIRRISGEELSQENAKMNDKTKHKTFNCAFEKKEAHIIIMCSGVSSTYKLTVSLLTNTVPVTEGAELLVETVKKARPQPKEQTWEEALKARVKAGFRGRA